MCISKNKKEYVSLKNHCKAFFFDGTNPEFPFWHQDGRKNYDKKNLSRKDSNHTRIWLSFTKKNWLQWLLEETQKIEVSLQSHHQWFLLEKLTWNSPFSSRLEKENKRKRISQEMIVTTRASGFISQKKLLMVTSCREPKFIHFYC